MNQFRFFFFCYLYQRKNYLVLELNHHGTKRFSEKFLITEIAKSKAVMSKLISLGFLILDISNIEIYEF